MHQVEPPVPAPMPRLSAPFFLRARRDALLRCAAPGVPPLTTAVLEHNAGNVRNSWPWKRGQMMEYYRGQDWHVNQPP